MKTPRGPSLEDRLAAIGVSAADLDEIRKKGHANKRLAELLIEKKLVKETDLLAALSAHFGLPLWHELPADHVKTDIARTIPIQYLRRHGFVPLETGERRIVATCDPTNYEAMEDIRRLLGGADYELVLSTRAAIGTAINAIYDGSRHTAAEFFQEMSEESTEQLISEIEETGDLLDEKSDAPIVKLVNLLLSGAVRDRASDIHIEPYQNSVKIRYRIDGILYDTLTLPRRIQSPLVSRIKIMGRLNIAEKRLPQDGRIEIRIGDRNVDIRVSVLPTAFGERVVLRLLDKTADILKLSDLGMDHKNITIFHQMIQSPFGIVLVTGPTGSGKSTTLYAALSTINSPEINIITIEDPIEYQINGVGQIQVNPKIDLTFANGLRSIVRQDPDVILVGEIRDRETAEMAIQSSLTGHLVFSTLHTNDAASAVTRLIDMGIEPFLVTSSIIAIVAQRLVRVLCPRCREPYVPDAASLMKIGIGRNELEGHTIYRKNGCLACKHTGYRDRTGIFEILIMDDPLRRLVLSTSDSNQINELAINRGMKSLFRDGVEKILNGTTTIEEVLRVTRILKREIDVDIEE